MPQALLACSVRAAHAYTFAPPYILESLSLPPSPQPCFCMQPWIVLTMHCIQSTKTRYM